MVWRVEGGIQAMSLRKHGRCFWPGCSALSISVETQSQQQLNKQLFFFSCQQWSEGVGWILAFPEPSEHVSLLVTVILYQSSVPYSVTCLQAFPTFRPLRICLHTAPHSSHLFSSLTCFTVLFPGLDVVTWFWHICFWTDSKILRIPLLWTAPKFCFLIVTQSHLTLIVTTGPWYAIV